MQIFRQVDPWRAYLKELRSADSDLGLVPTMGALHEGHLTLVRQAKLENDLAVCSIYINPAQFNNPSDLRNYPRTQEQDLKMLETAGCDVAFCPEDGEMYREEDKIKFDFGQLDKVLEGEFRPGHFSGVALVVSKLLNIIEPDRAYFGLKDFQQFKVVSRLVKELKFNVKLVGVPIVRERDGLAMSSRNRLLNPEERRRATTLYRCLEQTREGIRQGKAFYNLKEDANRACASEGIRLEYLALADKEDFRLLERAEEPSRALLLIAAYVGAVRLIDNLLLVENNN